MIGSSAPTSRPGLHGTDALFVTDDDFLLVTSLNSVAALRLTIGGRLLRRDGSVLPLAEPHTPNTDRTAATSVHKLTEGWLQSLTAIASAASVYGLTFVRVDLCRGSVDGTRTPIATLMQGIVTSAQRLTWPGSPVLATHERPGAIRAVAGSDPAAGAEISETVPTGARWRLLAISFELVTNATAATRRPSITLDDGATIYARAEAVDGQAASLTRRYTAPVPASYAVAQVAAIAVPLPLFPLLLPGHRIQTITAALQAGDNYGAPHMLVEERLEAN